MDEVEMRDKMEATAQIIRAKTTTVVGTVRRKRRSVCSLLFLVLLYQLNAMRVCVCVWVWGMCVFMIWQPTYCLWIDCVLCVMCACVFCQFPHMLRFRKLTHTHTVRVSGCVQFVLFVVAYAKFVRVLCASMRSFPCFRTKWKRTDL